MIYFDMDAVLCDFDGMYEALVGSWGDKAIAYSVMGYTIRMRRLSIKSFPEMVMFQATFK